MSGASGWYCGKCKTKDAPRVGAVCYLCYPVKPGEDGFNHYLEQMKAWLVRLEREAYWCLMRKIRAEVATWPESKKQGVVERRDSRA